MSATTDKVVRRWRSKKVWREGRRSTSVGILLTSGVPSFVFDGRGTSMSISIAVIVRVTIPTSRGGDPSTTLDRGPPFARYGPSSVGSVEDEVLSDGYVDLEEDVG